MVKFASRIIKMLPGYTQMSRLLRLRKAERQLAQFKDTKDIFTTYYTRGHWKGGGSESVCGAGSTLENTAAVRRELPLLISKLGATTFLDAPCGDYTWFNHVEIGLGVTYIGGDIVDDMIERNREQYGDERTTFMNLDVINDALPHADIWMCRDCLFHFSNDDIFKTLRNFLSSDIAYLLTTIHTDCRSNVDIPTGHWRALHLELPPFDLGKPILYIEDSQGKKLGLWHRDAVARALAPPPSLFPWL